VEAAHSVFSENKADFKYLRLDRINDEIKVKSYDADKMEAALDLDLEVR